MGQSYTAYGEMQGNGKSRERNLRKKGNIAADESSARKYWRCAYRCSRLGAESENPSGKGAVDDQARSEAHRHGQALPLWAPHPLEIQDITDTGLPPRAD
ncbi:hypothetical protein GCM10017711_39750 [Paeniglutamicibacter sulfureus]